MVSTRLPKPELWAISLLLSVVIIAVVYYVRILFKHCWYYFKYFFLSKNRGPFILYKKEEHGSSCFAKFFLARNRFLLTSLFSLLKNFFSFKIGNTIFCISKIRIKIKLLLHSAFQEKCLTENYRSANRWFSTTLLSILRDVPGLPYHMIRYKSKTSLVISYFTIQE